MALDNSSITRTGFNNVRIDSPLCQEVNSADFTAFVFKYANEFFPDNFTFLFRLFNAGQTTQETVRCIDTNEVHAGIFECRFNFVTFVFTHQTMVNEDTALEIRAAATELSTPPDNANNTLPSPTVLRISSTAVLA